MRLLPFRDFGLIPFPGASEQTLCSAEKRLGYTLPQSYRRFLARHDGWLRFFDGASLLRASELGNPDHTRLARSLFSAALSPSACSPAAFRRCPPQLLVFGVDAQGTTLFAFEHDGAGALGEPPVIAWLGEIGVRYRDFSDFVQGLCTLCDAELQALAGETVASPASHTRPRRPRSVSRPNEPLRKTG